MCFLSTGLSLRSKSSSHMDPGVPWLGAIEGDGEEVGIGVSAAIVGFGEDLVTAVVLEGILMRPHVGVAGIEAPPYRTLPLPPTLPAST